MLSLMKIVFKTSQKIKILCHQCQRHWLAHQQHCTRYVLFTHTYTCTHTHAHTHTCTHTHTYTRTRTHTHARTQVVADLLDRMRRQLTLAREVPPQIDAIVLLDRSVDLVTSLSTPLTYEALIDEIYGIKNSE